MKIADIPLGWLSPQCVQWPAFHVGHPSVIGHTQPHTVHAANRNGVAIEALIARGRIAGLDAPREAVHTWDGVLWRP